METILEFGFYPKIPGIVNENEPKFSVVKFEGEESISSLYSFTILVGVENCNDFHNLINTLLRKRVILDINYRGYKRSITGIASKVEFVGTVQNKVYLQINLVPKISLLTKNISSAVYLNKSIPEIIGEVLGNETKTYGDIAIDMGNLDLSKYPKINMLCRYNESTWDFINRLMERCGIYYYFKFSCTSRDSDDITLPSPESMIMSDHLSHEVSADLSVFGINNEKIEDPASLLSPHMSYEIIASKITSDSYDMDKTRVQNIYPQDEKEISFEEKMNKSFQETAIGTKEVFDSAFANDEVVALNTLRLEQEKVALQHFSADGSCPVLMSGKLITINDFIGESTNILLTKIHHEGAQASFMVSGLHGTNENNDKSYYRCHIEGIPSEVQYRKSFSTPIPKIYGLIPGIVEGPDSSKFSAYMDELGRYRIKLPFDKSKKMSGSSSCWVKLMTPYGGNINTIGMHFPLLKDTQVLIGFIDGNIDLPFIAGTIQDGTGSVVNNTRITSNVIRTPSGNVFALTDSVEPEGESFLLKNSYGYRALGALSSDLLETL